MKHSRGFTLAIWISSPVISAENRFSQGVLFMAVNGDLSGAVFPEGRVYFRNTQSRSANQVHIQEFE
jgi:hypothetical protein